MAGDELLLLKFFRRLNAPAGQLYALRHDSGFRASGSYQAQNDRGQRPVCESASLRLKRTLPRGAIAWSIGLL